MNARGWIGAFFFSTLWINASEVFRYFEIVMPEVRRELTVVPNVAPMSWVIFSIWALWDTILTVVLVLMTWLIRLHVSSRWRVAVVAGSMAWLAFFVLFWLAMVNMNLASTSLALTALPLAWLEMVVAAAIAHWAFRKFQRLEIGATHTEAMRTTSGNQTT
jgi:membrane-associated protease RseP (regulator of RpoE activity)